MQKLYQRRYKFANLANVVLFVLVVAGVSMLYGKLQIMQTHAATSQELPVRSKPCARSCKRRAATKPVQAQPFRSSRQKEARIANDAGIAHGAAGCLLIVEGHAQRKAVIREAFLFVGER
jgi:hypothetical protein